MAVGESIVGISGTGTVSDPYKPTTFGEFLSCIDVSSAYVCLENDIDVSNDSVYKTGISNYLDIKSTCIFGTAMTYNPATTYNQYDKCTWNDGDHGLCTYTCNVNGTVGIDVSDTTHWTRGGNPTKKITGLMVTHTSFMYMNSACEIDNIFFESCVFDKSGGYNACIYSSANAVFNDCSMSFFYNQHSMMPFTIAALSTSVSITLNRCSAYFRYNSVDLSSGTEYSWIFSGASTYFNNCTVDIENINLMTTTNPQDNPFIKNLNGCSLRCVCNLYAYGDPGTYYNDLGFSGTNSFFSITVDNAEPNIIFDLYPVNMVGTSVIDKDVIGSQASLQANANVVQGTTAQCKDKNWLISHGFFAS